MQRKIVEYRNDIVVKNRVLIKSQRGDNNLYQLNSSEKTDRDFEGDRIKEQDDTRDIPDRSCHLCCQRYIDRIFDELSSGCIHTGKSGTPADRRYRSGDVPGSYFAICISHSSGFDHCRILSRMESLKTEYCQIDMG